MLTGIVVAGCLLAGVSAQASVIPYGSFSGTVITFDNLAGSPALGAGEVLSNQYAGLGVTFSVPNWNAYATNGVLDTDSALTSKPNVIWVDQGGGGGGSSAQGMDINFSTPQSAVGLLFELSVDSTATLAVYDGASLLESVTSGLSPGGAGEEGYLALQDPGITKAIVYSTSPGGQNWNFSIDNLKFTSVPEPSTLLLLGVGLAMVAARRRFSARGM